MRKRFNELLDDAFSMFGSRSGSPEDKEAKNGVISTRPSDNRVHSAIVRYQWSFFSYLIFILKTLKIKKQLCAGL